MIKRIVKKVLRILKRLLFFSVTFVLLAYLIYNIVLTINFEKIYKEPESDYENPYFSENVQIHLVDVGQGDGIVITYQNKVVVIDAGPMLHKTAMKNYLLEIGVKRINTLIITHPHQDHFGGLDFILCNFKINKIYTTEISSDVDMSFFERFHLLQYNYLISKYNIINKFTKIYSIYDEEGKLSHFDFEPLKFTFLGPLKNCENFNNNSIVVRMDYKNVSALFTGDIEADAEEDLVKAYGESGLLDVDILKIAHHGSHTSSTELFLEATSPDIGLLSCAIDNDVWHPHKPVAKRLKSMGIKLYRTDEGGNIILTIDGDNVTSDTSEGDYQSGSQLSSS